MKLIKAINSGIVTSIGGEMYTISHDSFTEFSDEIAAELMEKFGALLEVNEVPVEQPVVEAVKEEKPKVIKKKKTK